MMTVVNILWYSLLRKEVRMSESFAHRLVRLREHEGLSQIALARRVGLTQSMLSLLEDGKREGGKVQAAVFLALADALGVTPEYLLTGEERRRPRRRAKPTADHDEELAYARHAL
jgi:transcriptional regulator with XRE-family HTH domain